MTPSDPVKMVCMYAILLKDYKQTVPTCMIHFYEVIIIIVIHHGSIISQKQTYTTLAHCQNSL